MSLVIVNVLEATPGGQSLGSYQLELPAENTTARELIRSRVFQRVKDFNAQRSDQTRLADELVPRTESELTLNGRPRAADNPAEWSKELTRAINAFQKNQILILVGDRQLSCLDEIVRVTSDSDVRFLRITMLAGG